MKWSRANEILFLAIIVANVAAFVAARHIWRPNTNYFGTNLSTNFHVTVREVGRNGWPWPTYGGTRL